ncbi:MAG: gyrase subunit [Bacilli bacterium]|nr:gyrase subunit [Bacilli bacterium]
MANIDHTLERDISQELRESFIDYAMSINVSRAIPDARDGLKPVHRRILFAMYEVGMTSDKPHKKSARVVGDVLAKYHPHGDASVYDALVRMAQDFSTRYPLVDGHGNFGSVDGDSAAAMRYTEARMSHIAMELLRDINKETVNFGDNYDGSEKEPLVLPSRYPNLLVNGSYGIAVAMATNIPPHNLREIIDGILLLMDNSEATVSDLMTVVKGPDFPTYGSIIGRQGIRQAYETGHGSITIRATTHIEELKGGKSAIIVTEIPYQVNKARLVEKIAELVRDKRVDGITDLRDESDRTGMRVVIELRRDVRPQVVLNNLFKYTELQKSLGINMLALVDGQPKILTLRDALSVYLKHQKEVIRRRTEFDLRKAEARAHILEGLLIALDHIEEVIALIRASATVEEARDGLMLNFSLSHEQAQAILDMRLQRLTGLERDKLQNEYNELMELIKELQSILADELKLLGVIRDELTEIREKYGDDRRTQIAIAEGEISEEDLIEAKEVVITITHEGYIKRLPVSTYRSQRRGGRGVTAMGTKEEDFVQQMYTTNSHHHLLFFTNKGKVYRLKAYEVPEYGRAAKGTPIINLLNIEQGEQVQAVIPIEEFDDGHYLFMITRQGIVKKTVLTDYVNIRKGGLVAVKIRPDDELIAVQLTDGKQEIIMGTRMGMSIRFPESEVRAMGRAASGVKGINLRKNDIVIDADVVRENAEVLVVTNKGYGKRTMIDSYRYQSRGGKGIKTMNISEGNKNGYVIALKVVDPDEGLMVITNTGVVIRLHVKDISEQSRITQGVKLIALHGDDEEVTTVAKVISAEDEELDAEVEQQEQEQEESQE